MLCCCGARGRRVLGGHKAGARGLRVPLAFAGGTPMSWAGSGEAARAQLALGAEKPLTLMQPTIVVVRAELY